MCGRCSLPRNSTSLLARIGVPTPGQVGSTDDARVIHQFGHNKVRLRYDTRARAGEPVLGLPDGVEQKYACDSYSTTEHEPLRVEHSAQRRTGLAQPVAELAKRLEHTGVAGDDELTEVIARQLAPLIPAPRER